MVDFRGSALYHSPRMVCYANEMQMEDKFLYYLHEAFKQLLVEQYVHCHPYLVAKGDQQPFFLLNLKSTLSLPQRNHSLDCWMARFLWHFSSPFVASFHHFWFQVTLRYWLWFLIFQKRRTSTSEEVWCFWRTSYPKN